MKKGLLITLALAGLVLAGCGGSNGGGSASAQAAAPLPDVPAPPSWTGGTPPPNRFLRLLLPGDTWFYDVTGTMLLVHSKTSSLNMSAPITGTITRVVTEDEYEGSPALKMTQTFRYTPNGFAQRTEIDEIYFSQDSEHRVTVLGWRKNGILMDVIDSNMRLPGTWEFFTNASGQTRLVNDSADLLSNGDITEQLGVNNSERVTTGVGWYTTWRAAFSRSAEMNFSYVTDLLPSGAIISGEMFRLTETVSGTQFWVPAIGNTAREEMSWYRKRYLIDEPDPQNTTYMYEEITLEFTARLRTWSLR